MKKFCMSSWRSPIYRRVLAIYSVGKEVIELGIGVQVLFQPEDPLVFDGIPDLAFRVEEVPEFARPHRAGFDAGRVSPVPGPLDAEGALFHDTLVPRTVAEIMGLQVEFLRFSVSAPPS